MGPGNRGASTSAVSALFHTEVGGFQDHAKILRAALVNKWPLAEAQQILEQ